MFKRKGAKNEKLKKIIEKSGMSVYQLSKNRGVGNQLIYDMVNGKRSNPTIKTAFKLADALGVDINEFREEENS